MEKSTEQVDRLLTLFSGAALTYSLSRTNIFNIWVSNNGCSEKQRHVLVLETLLASIDNVEKLHIKPLENRIANLCKRFSEYWKFVRKDKERFLSKYFDWMNQVDYVELLKKK